MGGIQKKVACIGDSLTFGYMIKNRKAYSYPGQLQNLLGNDYLVDNFGINGATVSSCSKTSYLGSRIYFQAIEEKIDIAVFFLGMNDAIRENWQNKEKFLEDYRRLLDVFLKRNPLLKVYLVSLPLVSENHWGIIPELITEEINPIILELGAEKNFKVILLHSINKICYQDDSVHFNEVGAELLAKQIFSEIYFQEQIAQMQILIEDKNTIKIDLFK